MTADTLLSRLDRVKKTGRAEWVARCPAHDDRNPSLSIAEAADGRVLVHCFSGCSAADVLDALGLDMADLFPMRDHDDVGRAKGWQSGKGTRQRSMALAPRTALVAIAHDITEAAVIVTDVADGRRQAEAVRVQLWTIAGRIASALTLSGVSRGR